jgi:sulfite exporter TauE/SafE
VLFTIFVFGPCEPLIPVLMYPAATGSLWGVALVTIIFGSVTIATMLAVVLVASRGVSLVPMGRMERYSHALAGAAIALSGMAIVFLGL